MATVVQIDWEGRGYTWESWEADRAVALQNLGTGRVWRAYFDVGVLFTNEDPKALESETSLVTTRHGGHSSVKGDSLLLAMCTCESGEVDGDPEAIKDLVGEWEPFESFGACEDSMKEEGILTLDE